MGGFLSLFRFGPQDDHRNEIRHLQTVTYSRQDRVQAIIQIVDDHPFKKKIFFVAASGFLSSSYSLFASNVISPAIFYVYPPCEKMPGNPNEVIDLATLTGTLCGMVVMGHCADRFGRQRLYGFELVLVIVATLGVAQSSDGYGGSMVIYGWIVFWRFALGFGIGAEYPLSAVISAEWASTSSRGLMLAAVFAMQSVGRLLAYMVGIVTVVGISQDQGIDWRNPPNNIDQEKMVVDMIWRTVIGVGVFPAALALILRVTIPETPRYDSEIKDDLRQAVESAAEVYLSRENVRLQDVTPANAAPVSGQISTGLSSRSTEEWANSAGGYLFKRGHWRSLLAISLLWFLLDLCLYGLSLDSPSLLATLWLDQPPADHGNTCNNDTIWRSPEPPLGDNKTIFQTLYDNSYRGILLTSISSITGSILILFYIDRIPRKRLFMGTCVALCVVFFIAGVSLLGTYANGYHIVTMVLYAVAQFLLNFGPNTLTFILAAEIFPTIYRGTFSGFAAAMGKAGAILIQIIIKAVNPFGAYKKDLLIGLLIAFAVIMLLSAGLAVLSWMPDVQEAPDRADTPRGWTRLILPERLNNKVLEDITADLPAEGDQNTLELHYMNGNTTAQIHTPGQAPGPQRG
ncbi:MFS general substrate transporter [Thozetella sp. PMI_491]|nr:MFS general substrate transporter [Thozetella sp. PMI_491]